MKKILVALMLCMVSISGFGQFVCKIVDNGFDEPFRKAICNSTQDSPNKGALCLERKITHPYLYIVGSYFCDDIFNIDVVFNNGNKYHLSGEKGNDSKWVHIEPYCMEFIVEDTEKCHTDWDSFWKDMEICSNVNFRINESHCGTNVYYFNLKGSTRAIKFTTIVVE